MSMYYIKKVHENATCCVKMLIHRFLKPQFIMKPALVIKRNTFRI